MKIDLHVHTTFSDGDYSPSQIVRRAKEKGIATLAITDHDSIDGLPEAFKHSGIELMSGVELGVDLKETEIHILGYLFDCRDENLKKALERLRGGREERNKKILEKLKTLGMDIPLEEVEKKVHEGSMGRPHIASVMVDRDYVSSIQEAFEKFLGKGKPAYVGRNKITAFECIRLILEAGGVPVLAHPKFIKGDVEALVAEYVGYGLQGIEVYYFEHTEEERKRYGELAEKYNLVMTGGTDFHGEKITPHVELGGTFIPSDVPCSLKKRWLDVHGKFRESVKEDRVKILEMTKRQMGEIVYRAWNIDLSEDLIRSLFESDKHTYVYCVRDEMVGYVTLEYEHDSTFIHSIILREDMTGFGAGGVFMEKIIAEAKARNLPEIRLNVQTPNLNAINFYVRWGFRKTREWNNNLEMVLTLRS